MNQISKWIIYTIVALFLLAVPFIMSEFFTTMMVRVLYFSLMAVAFAFLASQIGLVSLAIPAFLGLSGYTIAILETREIMFFPYSAMAAIVVVLFVSAVFGIFANRSKGIYFIMLTLILGQIIWAVARQWASVTNGVNGLIGISTPDAMQFNVFGANVGFYYVILFTFVLIVWAVLALTRSSFGMKLKGIRESESRMIMLGYRVSRLKWVAFVISSLVAGIAGVFFVYFVGVMHPSAIDLDSSAMVLIAGIFGGVYSIIGAVLGMSIVQTLEVVLNAYTQRYLIIIGIMFLLVVIYAPKGLMGLIYKNKYMKSLYDKWYKGRKDS
ncbi:branched-chain amino acid ABC transporter permease [Natribacillus halophilus]|uniref:Amino acid/amide ABC transporter membrane protein 2, HAAT family n=1 Tax=Natribacillus halophilus TaxID=549003 RepID=A0A1G8KGA8_9BACI|nr:branched-chain amino acid ABC transporter permease [Natribacillus halophilus]SDI42459.1 amino acid/amide ABC transporter membrane protein 2, HAAT family [Natribacillus halophilus]